MTITTKLYTYFNGKPVGTDPFGNRYFTEKKAPKSGKAKRWVIYNGRAEPSKVPPEWHGWLHYTHDVVPTPGTLKHHSWEQSHIPNLSGTKGAYVPPGHALRGGARAASTSDYEAWKP